ncbi:MAG: hypothetical protein R3Y26_00550 [Rikenellaceae bacterium]
MKKLLSLLLMLTGSLLFSNCTKNSYEGEVTFLLNEKYYGCTLYIYPYDYTSSSAYIYSTTIQQGEITVDLNLGNYKFVISGTTAAGTSESGTFQIMSKENVTYNFSYANS